MTDRERIEAFLAGSSFAVVGASRDRNKYGNKILRCYMMHDRTVYPVNPDATSIEGLDCYAELAFVPRPLHGISIITPPAVTERIVAELPVSGAGHVWIQPGAESERAVTRARALGLNVISGGPCLLVALGFREDWVTS